MSATDTLLPHAARGLSGLDAARRLVELGTSSNFGVMLSMTLATQTLVLFVIRRGKTATCAPAESLGRARAVNGRQWLSGRFA